MTVLGNYWLKKEKKIRERYHELYDEWKRLREICVPDKVQSYETPYLEREEIQRGLEELSRVNTALLNKDSFLHKICSLFSRVSN